MIDNYRSLLKDAALIYEKHGIGHKEPFNIFTVLRKASDEVNLHSRFLAALLDHQFSDTGRQNLKGFLQRVGIEEFEQDDAKIRREYRDIDILISNNISNNTTKQAVVIENKIYAEDQPAQLRRYHDRLEREGYRDRDIHLLYLTLDGRKPSEDSAGGLLYQTISYRDDLLPWLKCCQMYACDEPELRESIAQYIHLIRKLISTDFEEAYMNELQDLLSQDNNFVLAHDLNEALTRAKISLLQELWCDIDSALKNLKQVISDFPDKDKKASNISEENIKRYITGGSPNDQSLFYRIDRVTMLGVQLDRSYKNIFFGVFCKKTEAPDRHNQLRTALNPWHDKDWPSWRDGDEDLCFNPPNRKTLKLLSDEDKRKKFADGIADGLKEVWYQMKGVGLA